VTEIIDDPRASAYSAKLVAVVRMPTGRISSSTVVSRV
jgi:hypothetical protein